eukprot:GHVL01012156.1.p1 GENE.GHVL01012156.1~~GHVL01012156.1.p1  ORF type:complete len:958 (+),score=140.09 GHVL01012156.1:1584-4457(+)
MTSQGNMSRMSPSVRSPIIHKSDMGKSTGGDIVSSVHEAENVLRNLVSSLPAQAQAAMRVWNPSLINENEDQDVSAHSRVYEKHIAQRSLSESVVKSLSESLDNWKNMKKSHLQTSLVEDKHSDLYCIDVNKLRRPQSHDASSLASFKTNLKNYTFDTYPHDKRDDYNQQPRDDRIHITSRNIQEERQIFYANDDAIQKEKHRYQGYDEHESVHAIQNNHADTDGIQKKNHHFNEHDNENTHSIQEGTHLSDEQDNHINSNGLHKEKHLVHRYYNYENTHTIKQEKHLSHNYENDENTRGIQEENHLQKNIFSSHSRDQDQDHSIHSNMSIERRDCKNQINDNFPQTYKVLKNQDVPASNPLKPDFNEIISLSTSCCDNGNQQKVLSEILNAHAADSGKICPKHNILSQRKGCSKDRSNVGQEQVMKVEDKPEKSCSKSDPICNKIRSAANSSKPLISPVMVHGRDGTNKKGAVLRQAAIDASLLSIFDSPTTNRCQHAFKTSPVPFKRDRASSAAAVMALGSVRISLDGSYMDSPIQTHKAFEFIDDDCYDECNLEPDRGSCDYSGFYSKFRDDWLADQSLMQCTVEELSEYKSCNFDQEYRTPKNTNVFPVETMQEFYLVPETPEHKKNTTSMHDEDENEQQSVPKVHIGTNINNHVDMTGLKSCPNYLSSKSVNILRSSQGSAQVLKLKSISSSSAAFFKQDQGNESNSKHAEQYSHSSASNSNPSKNYSLERMADTSHKLNSCFNSSTWVNPQSLSYADFLVLKTQLEEVTKRGEEAIEGIRIRENKIEEMTTLIDEVKAEHQIQIRDYDLEMVKLQSTIRKMKDARSEGEAIDIYEQELKSAFEENSKLRSDIIMLAAQLNPNGIGVNSVLKNNQNGEAKIGSRSIQEAFHRLESIASNSTKKERSLHLTQNWVKGLQKQFQHTKRCDRVYIVKNTVFIIQYRLLVLKYMNF